MIDTSALLRFFVPDGPIPVGLEPALRGAAKGEASLIAPELILAESGQVLLKKRRQNLLEAEEFRGSVMSGSGSAFFGLCDDAGQATSIADGLKVKVPPGTRGFTVFNIPGWSARAGL